MPVPSQLVHKARGRKPAFQVSSKECSGCSSPLPLTLRLLGRALLLLGVGFRPLIWLLGGLLGLLLRAVFGGLLGLLFRPVLWLLGLLLFRPRPLSAGWSRLASSLHFCHTRGAPLPAGAGVSFMPTSISTSATLGVPLRLLPGLLIPLVLLTPVDRSQRCRDRWRQ